MAEKDEQLETYLREFVPRRPRALPEGGGARRESWGRFAAVAALLIAVASSAWFAMHGYRQVGIDRRDTKAALRETKLATVHFTPAQLNEMALQEPARFDAELTQASREVLPDFRGQASTLRVLAKE
jgi:hypothetical protein